MAQKDRDALNIQATQIKDEVLADANTATRVGQMLIDQNDSQMNIDDDAAKYDQSATTLVKTPQGLWEAQADDYGHTADIGQEIFEPCINQSGVAVSELEPKLFLLGKSNVIEPEFIDCILASANDLSNVALFGLNTSAADIGGKTNIVLLGKINQVKSDQWGAGDFLYAGTVAGELINSIPSGNAYPVARVEKSHPTEGILFVFTMKSTRIEIIGKSIGTQRSWFTGEESVITAGTFYKVLNEDKGSVPSVFQQVAVNDDSTVPLDQDLISNPSAVTTLFEIGQYDAVLSYDVSSSLAFDRLTIEYYLADNDGVVIDSGSGLPDGSYPFAPIVTLVSPLIDTSANVSVFAVLTGRVDTIVQLGVGQRVRVRVLCAKVGTAGSSKTFTVYYGSDHLSFADIPKGVDFGDLGDVEDNSITGDIMRKGSDNIWRNQSGNINDTSQLPAIADVAAYAGLDTGDILEWQAGGFWLNVPKVVSAGIQTAEGLTESIAHPANVARTYEMLTQAEYDSIGTPDSETIYFIVE